MKSNNGMLQIEHRENSSSIKVLHLKWVYFSFAGFKFGPVDVMEFVSIYNEINKSNFS